MEKMFIRGGKPLQGEVHISGAKNAVLGLIPAAILSGTINTIDNVPEIKDVQKMMDILGKMGAEIKRDLDTVVINAQNMQTYDCSLYRDELGKMRASYYLLGALLGRFHKAVVPLPGGCNIGDRPIDQHIKGFEALGATCVISHGMVHLEAETLKGADIYLDVVSVGATINIMLAAVLAEGETTIDNVAKEPHVVDVANFLNQMGADIKGAGTDTIRIRGVNALHGCNYSAVPDQITAGTYMIAAVATKGNVLVRGLIFKHMEALSAKLKEMGAQIFEEGDGLRVIGPNKLKGCRIKTLPYPGFPTDLQQPMAVLMSIAEGRSLINESIFESRFKYVYELRKMGADIEVNGRIANINGVERLSGTSIEATDLRAGAAMVVAGLVASGETEVTNLHYIRRGYENLAENLIKLGANIRIEKQTFPDEEE